MSLPLSTPFGAVVSNPPDSRPRDLGGHPRWLLWGPAAWTAPPRRSRGHAALPALPMPHVRPWVRNGSARYCPVILVCGKAAPNSASTRRAFRAPPFGHYRALSSRVSPTLRDPPDRLPFCNLCRNSAVIFSLDGANIQCNGGPMPSPNNVEPIRVGPSAAAPNDPRPPPRRWALTTPTSS